MKERGIPYSADMVRARRAGLKTQTRRVVKPQPEQGCIGHFGPGNPFIRGERVVVRCPYGQPGDRLLTREAWRTLTEYDAHPPRDVPVGASIWYEADGHAPADFGRYRHARFMCRWMSRGIDEVVDVRVERLQDISEADARAEGIFQHVRGGWHWHKHDSSNLDDWNQFGYRTARHAYQSLWEQINGAGSWDTNPYVWVVEFKRVMP